MAHASRRTLLAVHRHRLSYADLEDCYSQATVELVAQARRGELRYSSRRHLRNTLELRFASRIVDRRRALSGRSPAQAMLDGAMSLGGVGEQEVEIVDRHADIERRTMLRFDLSSVERAARALSPDQRLVLACQIGLQMGAEEFCATFGWTVDKHRKVAQRARMRLRALLEEAVAGERTVAGAGARTGEVAAAGDGLNEVAGACKKTFREKCPVLRSGSGEEVGTLL